MARVAPESRIAIQGEMLMKSRYGLLVGVLVIIGSFGCHESFGQADPFWLKSWDEAQQSRPERMYSSGRIASATEPGIPLVIQGQAVEPDGRTPAKGVVVHAYHRDQRGFDFGLDDRELTTWRLQGWVITDGQGRFEFQTIRPAPDHMGREGAHVHFTLESAAFGRQWARTVYFSDDALVNKRTREQSAEAGEFGWVRDVKVVDGTQRIDVKIRLKEKADF